MYKKFFGLKDNPFNVTPDPRYLYSTPHTEEALACLQYCVQGRKGFVMLTGDVGTGKTTLLNKLLEWLHQEDIASAFVFNPRLNPFQFLDYTLSDFGVNCASRLKSAILTELNQWLLDRFKAGSTAVLIVDEAQDASPELLEEIRLLANLETPSGKLLQIVLSGQQEFEMKLRLPEFRQLRQRISLRCKTFPLSLEETRQYVVTRLQVAGSDGRQIFSPTAVEALHTYSEGIPRVINILCEDSLINAFADHESVVPKEIVEAVAKELELDIYPPTAPPPLTQQPVYPREREGGLALIQPSEPDEPPQVTRKPAAPVPRPQPSSTVAAAPAARVAAPVEPVRKVEEPPGLVMAQPASAEAPIASRARETSNATAPAPRAPEPLLTPRPSIQAPQPPASEDEILQTLKPQKLATKPQPASPAPKPTPPPARPFVIPLAPKAGRSGTQGWILWAAVAGTLLLGSVGAIVLIKWRESGHAVSSPPATQAIKPPEPQAPALVVQPTPAPTSTAAVPSPATTTESQSPVRPAPTVQVEKKPEEPKPPVRVARQQEERPARVVRPRPQRAAPQPSAAEEPAAPADALVGGLVVTANIDGARISVDGRTSPEWVTPQALTRLPVGTHHIVVSKAGYEDVASQVVVQEGQTAVFRAQLNAAGGEINIITNPPGLGVSIDGGPFTPSPAQSVVGVGQHTYRIKLPDSRIYEGNFEMRSGSIITRRVDFSAGEWLTPAPPK